MTCAACQANVTRCVSKLPGVSEVNVSLLANNMTVSYDETAVTESDIVQAVSKIGYGASPVEQADAQGTAKGKSGFSGRTICRLLCILPPDEVSSLIHSLRTEVWKEDYE